MTTSQSYQNQNQNQIKFWEEALVSETRILHLILERNQKQHARAQYYRRMKMMLAAIRRCHIIKLNNTDDDDHNCIVWSCLMNSIDTEREKIMLRLQRYEHTQMKHQRRKQRRCEEWTIAAYSDDDNDSESDSNGKDKKILMTSEHDTSTMIKCENGSRNILLRSIEKLYDTITRSLPEILSRILHAASALYTELSRAYFVPLCTVSLACISRIRVTLMRMGRDSVVQLQRTLGWLKDDLLPKIGKDSYDGYMELEARAGLSVAQISRVLKDCFVREGTMENFIEVDADAHNASMGRREKDNILWLAYMNGSMSTSTSRQFINTLQKNGDNQNFQNKVKLGNDMNHDTHDTGQQTDSQLESGGRCTIISGKTIESSDKGEEVGECVDIGILSETSINLDSLLTPNDKGASKNNIQRALEDGLDTNLKLVSLLKPKTRQNATIKPSVNKKKKDKKIKEKIDDDSQIFISSHNRDTNNHASETRIEKESVNEKLGPTDDSQHREGACGDISKNEIKTDTISKQKKRKKSEKKKHKKIKKKKGDIFDEIFSSLC